MNNNSKRINVIYMQIKQITDTNEVLSLIRDLIHEKSPFYLRTGLLEYETQILRLKKDNLIIKTAQNLNNENEFVNFHFILDERFYYGQTKIKEVTKIKEIIAELPKVIYTRRKRKHKRVETKGKVTCQFNVISLNKDNDTGSESAPFFLRGLYYELKKNTPDIKKVFTQVMQELKKRSDEANVKFYKKNEKRTEIEELLIENKKSLFIIDSRDIKNYMIGYESPVFMSYGKLFQNLIKNGTITNHDIKKEAMSLMKKDRVDNRLSYVYVPLSQFGYIVGHIYVAYNLQTNKLYSMRDVLFLKSLGDIISEALTKNKLFKSEDGGGAKYIVEDISQGGMMLKILDPYILKFLQEGTKLSIEINIFEKKINCTGDIIRMQRIGDNINIGIDFLELSPKGENIIANFVETIAVGSIFPLN